MNRLKKFPPFLFFLTLMLCLCISDVWGDVAETWTPASSSYSGSVFSGTKMTITAEGTWQFVSGLSASKKADNAVYPDASERVNKGDLTSYLSGKTYFKIHAAANGTIKVKGLYGGNGTKIVCGISNYSGDVLFKSDATDNTAYGASCTIEFQVLAGRDYYVFVPNGGDVLFQGFEFYDATGISVTLASADNGTSEMDIAYPFFTSSTTVYEGNTAQAVNNYDITLKATPSDGYLFWRWHIGTGDQYSYSNNVTITDYSQYATNGLLTITPEFSAGIKVYTKVEGCGTVTFTHHGTQRQNGYWTTPYTDFIFTATPADGYSFDGWYNGDTKVSTENPYTASSVHNDLTLTAKFTRTDDKAENGTQTYDLSSFTAISNQGNVQSAAYNSTNNALVVTTKGAYNNYFQLYSGLSGASGTGIRISSKGEKYRIIIKTSDDKTFVKYVNATNSYTTAHYLWSDFNVNTSTPMTSEDVAKIAEIGLGGWNADDDTDKTFYVNGFWLDDIADYDNTIPCYGEEGGSYSNGTYTYTLNGTTAVFSKIDGNSRESTTNNIKFASSATLTLAKSGYKFTAVKLVFGSSSSYNLTIAGTTYQGTGEAVICNVDANDITITNNGSDALYINKVICTTVPTSINESRTVTTSGAERPYWIYVPASVKGTTTEVPVVFSLHGAGGDYKPSTGSAQNFNDLADKNNFIVIYPNGTTQSFPGWGGTTTGWVATGAVNADITYLKDIITALKASSEFKINANKIYITGFSNGGMMTYAAANAASDVFAAFASISGFPMNEMHLQHNGPRAVPFLHIHGKADNFVTYSYSPTIIDNMLARNGLSYSPTKTVKGSGYDYYEYTADGKQPYYFYAIDGMGHSNSANIDGKSNQEIIWGFFKDRTLNTAKSTVEFAPDVTNSDAASHGWTINSGTTIAQYGESGGYTSDAKNVYHSIQLKAGQHWLNFTATNSDQTKHIIVKLIKLGTLDHFTALSNTGFAVGTDDILMTQRKELAYYCKGAISFSFNTSDDAEYQLLFVKENANDATTVSGISITTTGTAAGTKVETTASTDFTGYFSYDNRLPTQWNFDECDAFQFNEKNISSGYWTLDDSNYNSGDGTRLYTYNKAIGNSVDLTKEASYEELTYDGNSSHKIAITAGLKFNATAENIKIKVSYSSGKATGVHLVVNEKVKMFIPYVVNTYRNDMGSDEQPNSENKDEYINCLHHWKRDILYVSLEEGNVWNIWNGTSWIHGHVLNKCIDDSNKDLFNSGGEEYVNNHHFYKMNYMGNDGTPCIVQFQSTTSFNRIGVNRNLTYSFYSEYVGDFGNTYTKPQPRMRVVGSPVGQMVANLGLNHYDFTNAIAMTYGGWKNSSNEYSYTAYNGDAITDSWSELGVFNGDKFYTQGTLPEATQNYNIPVAADGFSVISKSDITATSENLMPSNATGSKYHGVCEGKFATSYTQNYTPWTLPCRGAYLKFEPTLPGVLNIDVLQYKDNIYYIADEFGNIIAPDMLFTKTALGQQVDKEDNGYILKTNSDYVKYSFNVYPGKSYYIFSPTVGIGFTGFYYEPYVYRKNANEELAREDVELQSMTLEDGVDYSTVTKPTSSQRTITSPGENGDVSYTILSSHKAVAVTLNRSFKANTWNSICLPFSMNTNAMETVFGKGTHVVLLRDVQDRRKMASGHTTANFIMHENQDIIAGYPYLIYPTRDVSSIKTNAYIPDTTPDIPEISGRGFKTTTGASLDTENYGGLSDYTFKGTFSNVTARKGSYYINTKGSLSRCSNDSGVSIKPYRAYLEFMEGSNYQAKAIEATFFGDTDDNLRNFDINDVNAIIAYICGEGNYDQNLDMNNDGEINISDVNATIAIICGNE